MARLLSVALTEQAVVNRQKTVTRRLGWWEDRNGRRLVVSGNHLCLVRKSMGRKADEPLVRLAQVEVVDVRREQLDAITDGDVAREGFPDWDAPQFVKFFTESMCCDADTLITRIEWRYLP